MRKTTTLFALGLCLSGGAFAQTWNQIYTYDVQEPVWDKPRSAVSADNIVMVGMETNEAEENLNAARMEVRIGQPLVTTFNLPLWDLTETTISTL